MRHGINANTFPLKIIGIIWKYFERVIETHDIVFSKHLTCAFIDYVETHPVSHAVKEK